MSTMIQAAGRMSRQLSWNSPTKSYYSCQGQIICPSCNSNVNLRDLIKKRGIITCKKCQ